VRLVAGTLLAFLTTSCTECEGLWERLGEWWPRRAAKDLDLAIVTPSRSMENEAEARRRAPAGAALHMASETWFGFGVTRAGTFVLVGATGAGRPWEAPFEAAVLGQAWLPASATASELDQLVAGWLGSDDEGLGKAPQGP
jgi:hypothetical protein